MKKMKSCCSNNLIIYLGKVISELSPEYLAMQRSGNRTMQAEQIQSMLNTTANAKTRFPVSWSRLFDLEEFGRAGCPNRDYSVEKGLPRNSESEK